MSKTTEYPWRVAERGDACKALYRKCLANGCAPTLAEMLALQEAPGAMTDRELFQGMGTLADQFKGEERNLTKLVAAAKDYSPSELFNQYETLLTEALRLKSTAAKHSNVLLHALGYFKKMLTSDEKQEMVEVIDSYRQQLVPLIVPVTLLNHYVRKYREPYLAGQVYLNPHPLELKLRNHV